MKKKGKRLEFISRIKRDGKGVVLVNGGDMSHLDGDTFELCRLSITNNTYIAANFNVYVVKLKQSSRLINRK